MNEDGKKGTLPPLEDAVLNLHGEFVRLKDSAEGTLERNRGSMDSIMSVLGKSIRLKSITTSLIDLQRRKIIFKGYSPNGIII